MKLQFLTPTLHGALDYAAAAALIVLPFLLGLGADSPIALWLSVAGGAGLVLYSLLTDYAFGAARVLSYGVHLVLDLLAAAAFLAAPFLFGFAAFTSYYYFVMAGGVIVVVALSERPAPAIDES
jgi:accessory gene regulator protein AgrB